MLYTRKLSFEIEQRSAMISFIVEIANALFLQAWLIAENFIGRGDGCSVAIGFSNWNNFAIKKHILFYII